MNLAFPLPTPHTAKRPRTGQALIALPKLNAADRDEAPLHRLCGYRGISLPGKPTLQTQG